MKNFRDYESMIRDIIKEMNQKDENWIWSIHSFGKTCVTIRWGYLDYISESKKYFTLNLEEYNEEFDETVLTFKNENKDDITCYFISSTHTRSWQDSYEVGISSGLNYLFSYAHSRY